MPTPTAGTPGDPFAIPFGTRPTSGKIVLSGSACSGTVAAPFTISNKTFRDLGAGTSGRAIDLTNCTNVLISQVDFINVAEGVIAHGGSNITVRDSRFQNILGPAHCPDTTTPGCTTIGSRPANVANFVQFDNTNGAHVLHNKGKCGDSEDIVSFTGSTSNSEARDNQFEGVLTDSTGCLAWKSNSGSGIATADGNATNNWAVNNIVLNPGQVGIFLSGGTNGHIDSNIIVGQQRPLANVGAYIYGANASCGDTFRNNRINWSNASGGANPYYDRPGDGCSPDETGSTPEGGRDTGLDPNAYRVQL